MSLPESIQIGPIRYRVTTEQADYNAVVAEENVHFWGHIKCSRATITLDPNQTDDHSRWALLHEVLHGCWHVNEPEGVQFTEEQAIRTLTGALLDTLRRNPELVSYLLEVE